MPVGFVKPKLTHSYGNTCPTPCNNCTEEMLLQKLIVYFRLVRLNHSNCKAKPQCRKGILPSPWLSPKTFLFLCSYQVTAKERHSHLNAGLSDNLKAGFTLALFHVCGTVETFVKKKKGKSSHRRFGDYMALRKRSRVRFQAVAVTSPIWGRNTSESACA